MIYRTAKRLSPRWAKRFFHTIQGLLNRRRSATDIFAELCSTGRWGDQDEFYSWVGTGDDGVTSPYLFAIYNEVERLGMSGKRFVDLGCGDFRVGSKLASCARSYFGADIVPVLIEHFNEVHEGGHISFCCINVIDDPLPEGDLCFVR